jgi:hypothetical protein
MKRFTRGIKRSRLVTYAWRVPRVSVVRHAVELEKLVNPGVTYLGARCGLMKSVSKVLWRVPPEDVRISDGFCTLCLRALRSECGLTVHDIADILEAESFRVKRRRS